jgi:hypothetical protein
LLNAWSASWKSPRVGVAQTCNSGRIVPDPTRRVRNLPGPGRSRGPAAGSYGDAVAQAPPSQGRNGAGERRGDDPFSGSTSRGRAPPRLHRHGTVGASLSDAPAHAPAPPPTTPGPYVKLGRPQLAMWSRARASGVSWSDGSRAEIARKTRAGRRTKRFHTQEECQGRR